ncbi:MAG: tyrosine-type recombinase/integrase [Alphaproteobacteria bacterium]|nr:tyrosine-type recombinase/integrase [Alphaproteobacteria bacterium]
MSKTPAKTVSPLRTRMIEQMRMGALSSGTQRFYLGAIRSLARDTGTAPDQLDAEQVRAWVLGLIDRGLAPASTNATLSALRFFFCEVIDRPEVVHGLRNRKRPRRLPCHMAEHEVERLLLATPDLRYRTAILLTYAAGLRISETVAVQVVDIKADRKLLHIRSGKGDVERLAPLPEPVIGYLRGYWQALWPRPAPWLFYGRSPEVPIKAEALRKAFNAARDRAGIRRDTSFHALRHSAATHWHERGGSIDVIQDALGHRNADTTRAYARATGKMFEALDHPVSGFRLLTA